MSSEPLSREPLPRRAASVPFTPISGAANGGSARGVSGYADGYAVGWAAGSRAAASKAEQERRAETERNAKLRAEHTARVEHALATLEAAARAARDRVVPVLAQAEQELTQAAVELAEAVLGAELRDRGASLRAAVHRALDVEGDDRVVRIRLHPADLAALDDLDDALRTELRIPKGVELVADASLELGDAISEFEDGILDARLSTALRRIRHTLDPGA